MERKKRLQPRWAFRWRGLICILRSIYGVIGGGVSTASKQLPLHPSEKLVSVFLASANVVCTIHVRLSCTAPWTV